MRWLFYAWLLLLPTASGGPTVLAVDDAEGCPRDVPDLDDLSVW